MQQASGRQASTAASTAATPAPLLLLLLLALNDPASVLLCPLLLHPDACSAAAVPSMLLLLSLLDIAALNRATRTSRLLLVLRTASSCMAICAADRLQLCFATCGQICHKKTLHRAAAEQASS
jgi:hypothetical protein